MSDGRSAFEKFLASLSSPADDDERSVDLPAEVTRCKDQLLASLKYVHNAVIAIVTDEQAMEIIRLWGAAKHHKNDR